MKIPAHNEVPPYTSAHFVDGGVQVSFNISSGHGNINQHLGGRMTQCAKEMFSLSVEPHEGCQVYCVVEPESEVLVGSKGVLKRAHKY